MRNDPYPFHRQPRYDAAQVARMMQALEAHDARKRRVARINRIARAAVYFLSAALAVALFYSATN